MPANEIHVNDIGTQFLVTISDGSNAENISNATVKRITFARPDNTTLIKDATFYTDGTDGLIYYTTVSGDLNQAGNWKLQGKIEAGPSGWHSDIYTFTVHRNL